MSFFETSLNNFKASQVELKLCCRSHYILWERIQDNIKLVSLCLVNHTALENYFCEHLYETFKIFNKSNVQQWETQKKMKQI